MCKRHTKITKERSNFFVTDFLYHICFEKPYRFSLKLSLLKNNQNKNVEELEKDNFTVLSFPWHPIIQKCCMCKGKIRYVFVS